MALPDFMSTGQIGHAFTEEIEALGGRVTDRFDDRGSRLFLRSTLPEERNVRSGDRLQGGVALMATEAGLQVHPYVFRQVCTNGAIRAHAVQTRRLGLPASPFGAEESFSELRLAIRACADREAFAEGVEEMRSTLQSQDVDLLLTIMPMLSRLAGGVADGMIGEIISRAFREEGGRATRFGWMNAMTSVARDTPDPDVRWRLEQLGGGVPVLPTMPQPRPSAAAAMNVRELVTA